MDFDKDYSGQRIDKYYLVKRLGNGSFGVVYRVEDKILNAEKALKILNVNDPQKVASLYNEAAIPYKCRHKNIVYINDANVIQFNNEPLFVIDMQLVHGGSLEDALKRKSLSIADTTNIINNVLFGLCYAHGKGIIHRDIKPANILLDKNNIPLLSDFGLSTFVDTVITPKHWYITHAAPECFIQSVATEATDIYALGMTMYRLINTITDWQGMLCNIPNINTLLLNGKLIEHLSFQPYVPNQIVKIIKKACAPKPQSRYKCAADMRNDIHNLRYNFSWYQFTNDCWYGRKYNGSEERQLLVDQQKKGYEFVSKKNNRRINEECIIFNNLTDARDHMYKYIRESTLL